MHSNYSDGGHSAVLCTLPLTGSLNSGYAVRYHSPKPLRASLTRQLFEGQLYSYKVTDIYWRALGRNLLARGYNPVLEGEELQSILEYSKFFLTIGLGRLFRGRYWPLIVGVHTVPYFPVRINYENI